MMLDLINALEIFSQMPSFQDKLEVFAVLFHCYVALGFLIAVLQTKVHSKIPYHNQWLSPIPMESWFLWAALSKFVSSEGRGQSSRLHIRSFQQQQPL